VEEGQTPSETSEPVNERARIAGVEAGVAAGLVSPARDEPRPESKQATAVPETEDKTEAPDSSESPAVSGAHDLPDWTDPPTLQVPRVLLNLEQEAAAERVGPPLPAPGGPVWRERQEDWAHADTVLGDLANSGAPVSAYEESSSSDPFAYDFLGFADGLAGGASTQVPAAKDAGWAESSDEPGSSSEDQTDTTSDSETLATADLGLGSQDEGARVGPESREPRHRHRRHPVRRPGVGKPPWPGSGRPRRPAPIGEEESAPEQEREPAASKAKPAARSKAKQRALPAAPDKSSTRRSPLVATLTGIGLALIVLACFKLGPLAVLVLAAVALTLAAAELFNSLRLGGYAPATLLGLIAVPATLVGAYFRGPKVIVAATAIFIVATMLWYLAGFTRRSPLTNLSVTVLAFGWTGVLGSFAGLIIDPSVFGHRHGIAFLMGVLIGVVGYDVGGYGIGSWLGRHRLAPLVSPNKTWEGLIGGCAVAIGASAGITSQIHPWHVSSAIVLGVIVAVLAPCGDLVESMIKRELHVKDMGSLLPGHGGIFDRVDALLFVIPAVYYFVHLAHIG